MVFTVLFICLGQVGQRGQLLGSICTPELEKHFENLEPRGFSPLWSWSGAHHLAAQSAQPQQWCKAANTNMKKGYCTDAVCNAAGGCQKILTLLETASLPGIRDLVAWKCHGDTTGGVVAQKEKRASAKTIFLLKFSENVYRTRFFSPPASKLDFKRDN